MERKLTPIMKAIIICVGVGSIAIAIFLGALACTHDELPPLVGLGLAAGSAFAFAWALLVGWTLKKGTWFGKIQPTIIARLSWTLVDWQSVLSKPSDSPERELADGPEVAKEVSLGY